MATAKVRTDQDLDGALGKNRSEFHVRADSFESAFSFALAAGFAPWSKCRPGAARLFPGIPSHATPVGRELPVAASADPGYCGHSDASATALTIG